MIEVLKGPHTKIIIRREEKLNSLCEELISNLSDTFIKLENDPDIRVVSITGAGKAFVAGADISEFVNLTKPNLKDYILAGQNLMKQISSFSKPVIAKVNGYCLGGGLELALACDIIVAAEVAVFGLPEVSLGLIPGFGGTQRLALRVNPAKASQLIFSGRKISASEAKQILLIDELSKNEELDQVVEKLADEIISRAPLAVTAAKKIIAHRKEKLIIEGLQSEMEEFVKLMDTQDAREGTKAFIEKRQAKFVGK